MAKIFPFKAVRSESDKISLVSSRAVFTYGKRELNALLDYNPFSFLQIINPERKEKIKTRPNTLERFLRVKGKYEFFINEKVLVTEEKPALYVYEQRKQNGESYIGFIGAGSVSDYTNGVIKPHEETITRRKKIFKEYLDACQFNAEPVLLTYPSNNGLNNLLKNYQESKTPLFDFTAQDGIGHRVWKIENTQDLNGISDIFEGFNEIYIADGHHRMASSHLYSEDPKSIGVSKVSTGSFMAYFIDEAQLLIHGFNRLVKDLNGLSVSQFVGKLSDSFNVGVISIEQSMPKTEGVITMFLDGKWFELSFRGIKSKDPVERLDASILNRTILEPILGIHDLRNDRRISFIGGENVLEEVEAEVNKGKFKVAFCLHPISIKDLKDVADAKEYMPPKSSWIEPKLRSGMLIMDYKRSM